MCRRVEIDEERLILAFQSLDVEGKGYYCHLSHILSSFYLLFYFLFSWENPYHCLLWIALMYRYLDAAAIRRTMGSGASEQEVEDMLGRDMVYDLW